MVTSMQQPTAAPPVAEQHQEEEVIDDWGLPLDFQLFARREQRVLYGRTASGSCTTRVASCEQQENKHQLHHDNNKTNDNNSNNNEQEPLLVLECVESLTPIDMVQLGSGIHDATGQCVWTGALVLMELLPELKPYFRQQQQQQQQQHQHRIIELGCGTGIGLLILLKSQHIIPTISSYYAVFTDADPEALELCERNCQLNSIPSHSYGIVPWKWGSDPPPIVSLESSFDDITKNDRDHNVAGSPTVPTLVAPMLSSLQNAFDIVLATDVIYDIGLLDPFFQTAAMACYHHTMATTSVLHNSTSYSHLILSHIPRACYSTDYPANTILHNGNQTLEDVIIQRAKQNGFDFVELIRPNEISISNHTNEDYDMVHENQQQQHRHSSSTIPHHVLNRLSRQDMQEIGAAIFVFRFVL